MTRVEMNDLNVLLISTSYPADELDWRGRFIADMATAISKRVKILSMWTPPGKLPPNAVAVSSEQDKTWLAQLMFQGGIAHLLRTRPIQGLITAASLLRRLANVCRNENMDVIHVNWLQNALVLRKNIPALITVLGSDYKLLRLPGIKWMLRKIMTGRPVIIAPNANWMQPELERHFGDVAEIRPIPFGVDTRWFEIQRIPSPDHKWIAVMRITHDKLGDLLAWGKGHFGRARELHLFGPMQEKIALPDWIIWHGPTNPDELAQKWFPYATGLITLSHHSEGRPQVLLEAMAAGLPAVVSNQPAHSDVVIHGETGWIANSPKSFAEAIEQAEDPGINLQVGSRAKSYIRTHIGDWDHCADRYASAYRDLHRQHHES